MQSLAEETWVEENEERRGEQAEWTRYRDVIRDGGGALRD